MGSTVVTRCDGKPEEFPCYCNPSSDSPFDFSCPYCSFATDDGRVVCAKDEESVSFTDRNGEAQTCMCSVENLYATPISSCNRGITISSGQEDDGGVTGEKVDVRRDTCSITLPSGETRVFNRGDSLGQVMPNRCGKNENFPCFCNPDLREQIECPYCRFPSESGVLVCAKDGETVFYTDLDGVDQTCECEIPDDPTQPFRTNCSGGGVDPSETDVCTLELENGTFMTFQNGESYGEYLETRCGPSSEWPCYCDTSLPGHVYCPYCGFADGEGQLYCARDNGSVDFEDAGVYRSCSCEFSSDRTQKPTKTCTSSLDPPTLSPGGENDDEPSAVCIVTIEGIEISFADGESFGGLIEGVCGTPDEYPAFCNPKESQDDAITRQDTSGEQVEYPYCIFTNTESGDTVCAKDNEDVIYVDTEGVEVICTCLVAPPELGGADALCRPNTATPRPSSPTSTQSTPAPSPPVTNPQRGVDDDEDDSASVCARTTILGLLATMGTLLLATMM
jgi:hypothetical protein